MDLTFYPTEDGDAFVQNTNSTFSGLRSHSGTDHSEHATVMQVGYGPYTNFNKWFIIGRGIIFFDTSDIPDGATITDAVFSFTANDKHYESGDASLHICGNDSTGVTIIKDSDYQDTRGTSYGSIDYDDVNTNGVTRNSIALSSTGLAWIKKGGTTRFTLRLGSDMTGNPPAWWSPSGFGDTTFIEPITREVADVDRRPKLVVTYVFDPPTVTTEDAGSVTTSSAFGNGTIVSTGGEDADERGVVYDTSTHTNPGNVDPATSDYPDAVTETGTFGTGAFSESITGLDPATTYYVRAYAANPSGGYTYGDEITFTTGGGPPVVTTEPVTDNDALGTATGNGTVVSDNGSTILERGIEWSTSPSFSPVSSDSTSGTTGVFDVPMTGLLSGALYYVRAYAINALGIAYGDIVSFTAVDFLNPEDAYGDDSDYMTAQADTGAINISLSGDGGSNYSGVRTSIFNGSETTNIFGAGSTEVWGTTWTGLNINDANFRLKIQVGTNPAAHIYKEFGFAPSDDVILTGIEVAIKGFWDGSVMSVNHIKIKIYYGTSTTPVESGAQAFATDGGADGLGALMIYDGSDWRPAGEGEGGGGGSAVWGDITGDISDQTDLQTELDAKQPLDSDLSTIASLTATTNNFMVAVSNAWASRTPAQAAATLQAEIGKLMYPVGSIYISVNSTNPATSLGFGTWSAFGAGRVPVGFDSGDPDFDTDEETGGAKTVASNVAVATQPTFSVNSHSHPLGASGHALVTIAIGGAASVRRKNVSSYNNTHLLGSTGTTSGAGSVSTASEIGGDTEGATAATTRTADVALTNNATSVQQKYITVRMWKRTA